MLNPYLLNISNNKNKCKIFVNIFTLVTNIKETSKSFQVRLLFQVDKYLGNQKMIKMIIQEMEVLFRK